MASLSFLRSVQFFRDHAGYSVPPGRMACAITLAKAELVANARGWSVQWEPEDLDPADSFDRQEDIDAVRSGKWLWLYAYVDVDGEHGASLGGITLTGWSDPYKRVIEAQLFSEVINTIETETTSYAALYADVHTTD